MIIARSPLRISFAGGGTDIPAFYQKNGYGFVVSTAIDRHVYVTLAEKFDNRVSVRYRVHENVETVDELKHPLIREILRSFGVSQGIEIVCISDVPAKGSGLGASSALGCALVAALDRFCGHTVNEHSLEYRMDVARRAAMIEIGIGSPIGKQDQYASAVGGLNAIRFLADGSVDVTPFEGDDFKKEIAEQSMLFYLDIEHEYQPGTGNFVQNILRDQVEDIEAMRAQYILQRDNATELWNHMTYEVPERFMDHINENWRIKRKLHGKISSPEIDRIIQRGYSAGATASKVCGAGGGGFVYFLVPPSMQDMVRHELRELRELRFGFDDRGVDVIYDDRRRYEHALR